uniref:Uncharacterized protein n=1 Tax=Peronospora matthiolae TaxID=2874970 RepID=A0AAV1T254_9STRA
MASSSPSTATIASPSPLGSVIHVVHGSTEHISEPVTSNDEAPAKQSYFGKCQYKTGKCFNERTLKRNGDAHSLCEEHRVKQNMIQRRSDRKYQTVHAIRRRERSLRRAVLKKQVSMAVAQQLFYEHQQQKVLAVPHFQQQPDHPVHRRTIVGTNCTAPTPGVTSDMDQVAPIRVPQPALSRIMDDGKDSASSPLVLSFESQNNRKQSGFKAANKALAAVASCSSVKDESTPTGIDNFMPRSFLHLPMPFDVDNLPVLNDVEMDEISLSDNFGYMPIVSRSGDKETWSEDDIEFLQTILLA